MNEKRSLNRREFLKLTSVLSLSGYLAACSRITPEAETEETLSESISLTPQEAVELIQFIWVGGGQGIVPRELKAEYERDHPNVTIELYEGTNSATYPKMVAQKEVNPNDPLINFGFFNSEALANGDRDDMWESLDPAKIPNLADIFDKYHRPDNKGILWGLSGVGIMYNSDLVTEPPTSWMDIFDPIYKGKVMIHDYKLSHNGFMGVKKCLGDDIDKTFQKFGDAAKEGQFHSVFEGNQMLKDAMARGEVLIAPHFTNFAITWGPKGEGGPFGYVIPAEGAIAIPFGLTIVKGSTQAQIDVASDIINQFLSEEWLSRYCSLTSSIPTSKYAKLDKDLALEPVFQKDVVDNAITVDFNWLSENDAELKNRWDREVKANL